MSIVCSVSVPPVALATPKSITFGTGLSSYRATSTFDGLMSRWMIPFWWACWIAWHTGTNSSSRSFGVSLWSSQYSVIGTPLTSSMTKNGRPSCSPPSSTLAMFGWSISASACRSASNRASTCFESIPALMSLTATSRLTGSVCLARQTDAHAPLADHLDQLVLAGDDDAGLLVLAAIVVDDDPWSDDPGLIGAGLRASRRRSARASLSVPDFRGGMVLGLIEARPIEQRVGTEVRIEELVEPQAQLGTAGAFAFQQGGAFGRVGDGDGGGEQVEFVHRIGPPTRLA